MDPRSLGTTIVFLLMIALVNAGKSREEFSHIIIIIRPIRARLLYYKSHQKSNRIHDDF